MSEEQVDEAKYVYKVDAKGSKTRKLKCKPGFKRVDGRCVRITGGEKATKKKAIRKAVRTKRADASGRKRASKKRLKALKKRKSYGL